MALSAVTFYLDYLYGFAATRTFTLYAVIAYFALNGALTYWIWGVEAGCVFQGECVGLQTGKGEREGKVKVRMSSHAPAEGKYLPLYCLTVETEEAGKKVVKEVKGEYRRWFDDEGRFVTAGFREWLREEVDVVGRVDRGSGVGEAKKGR